MFELDVQLAGESVVVSHYLPVLGLRGWLENDNWALRWRGLDPTLHEVAADVPSDRGILLDPKETAPARRNALTERILAGLATAPDRDRYRVSTRHEDDLERYRAAGVRTWRTIGDRPELGRVLAGGPREDDAVSVRHTMLSADAVARLHAIVPDVVAWTVNTVARADQLRAWGVDGLTTDSQEVMVHAAA
jgi:glycerophosphoryl diester phosphodiesterase